MALARSGNRLVLSSLHCSAPVKQNYDRNSPINFRVCVQFSGEIPFS
jgi:hypothetical protein